MKRYNPFYFIAEALKSLKRNGVMTFASVAVLLSCLIVMGGFAILIYNININLEKFGLLNEIVVFCNFEADEDEISRVEEAIKALDNIDTVTHITKEEGLASLKEESPAYEDITEEENPLSDSFSITYKDNSKASELDYQLRQIEGVRKVANRLDIANSMANLKSGVMLVFIWFFAILFVVTIFIIVNTIKLAVFSRRNEISIMRYIGATNWFITLPFIFEGIFIGTAASLGSYLIVRNVYNYMVSNNDLQMITIVPFSDINSLVLLSFFVIGILTGIIGSSISLGKYLKD